MYRRVAWLLIVALFSAGLLTLGGARDAERARLQELSPAIGPGVIETLERQERVEVLISLKSPDSTPDTWTRERRRANALSRQDAVLAVLAGEDFILTHRFEAAAALSGSVTATGFRKLSAQPDVTGIALARSSVVLELGDSVPLIRADLVHAIGYDGSGRVQGGLLHSDRSNLSVCVDGAAGFNISDKEVEAVRAALESGLASVPDAPGVYSQPAVVVGCPAPPAALVDRSVKPANRGFHLGVIVGGPSNHLLFVYFMAQDTYTTSFGSGPYSKADAELVCTFDNCVGVTLSVYFPQPAGGDVLREGLLDILNLLPRPPEPTIDWQACERGEQPNLGISCDDYEDYRRDLELEQEDQ